MGSKKEVYEVAWVRLIRAQRALLEKVEKELKAAGFPPLIWYDVLWELERSQSGLRQYELGEAMLLSKHNLSRLLDRMQDKGLLVRESCVEDGRGSVISITQEGRQLRKNIWPVYSDAINRVFEGRVSKGQALEFSNTLKSLLD